MPRFDVRCQSHGVHEIFRHMRGDAPFCCEAEPGCDEPVEQVFSPEHVHHVRVDDMASVGAERTDPRTHRVNLGLGGQFVEVGRRADGSKIMDYRPTTSAEASSNKKAKEIARRQGLSPADSGRYRCTR